MAKQQRHPRPTPERREARRARNDIIRTVRRMFDTLDADLMDMAQVERAGNALELGIKRWVKVSEDYTKSRLGNQGNAK